MPSRHTYDDHIAKSEHDIALGDQLYNEKLYPDWALTCAFYFAVHCVDAYAHKNNKERELEPASSADGESRHSKRWRFVRNNLEPQFIGLYKNLYNKSRRTRYDPTYFKYLLKNKGAYISLFNKAKSFEKILQ